MVVQGFVYCLQVGITARVEVVRSLAKYLSCKVFFSGLATNALRETTTTTTIFKNKPYECAIKYRNIDRKLNGRNKTCASK